MSFEQLFESMYERGGIERSVYQQVLDDPKFQRWFKGSQVVDDDGIPFPCYHGTSADIKKFDHNKGDYFGVHFGTYYQAENRMAMMDKDRSAAKDHDTYETPGSNVTPVFLKIVNPLTMPDVGSWDHPNSIAEILVSAGSEGYVQRIEDIMVAWDKTRNGDDAVEKEGTKVAMQALRAFIQEMGHDGVRYVNEHESDNSEVGRGDEHQSAYSWIVFDSSQIKSAIANKGAYDDLDNMLERKR